MAVTNAGVTAGCRVVSRRRQHGAGRVVDRRRGLARGPRDRLRGHDVDDVELIVDPFDGARAAEALEHEATLVPPLRGGKPARGVPFLGDVLEGARHAAHEGAELGERADAGHLDDARQLGALVRDQGLPEEHAWRGGRSHRRHTACSARRGRYEPRSGAPGRSASPIPKSAAPTAESDGMVPTSVVCSSSMRPANPSAASVSTPIPRLHAAAGLRPATRTASAASSRAAAVLVAGIATDGAASCVAWMPRAASMPAKSRIARPRARRSGRRRSRRGRDRRSRTGGARGAGPRRRVRRGARPPARQRRPRARSKPWSATLTQRAPTARPWVGQTRRGEGRQASRTYNVVQLLQSNPRDGHMFFGKHGGACLAVSPQGCPNCPRSSSSKMMFPCATR